MKEEEIKKEILEKQMEDTEAGILAKYASILSMTPESNLEVIARLIEPETKEHFPGMYREISLGNLDYSELMAVRRYLSIASILAGMYDASRNTLTETDLAYIEDLWKFVTVKAYVIINTSKSKYGFLAKLLKTNILRKDDSKDPFEKKEKR